MTRLKKLAFSAAVALLAQAAAASAGLADGPAELRLPVSYHHQEHNLSCEAAALKMVLDYLGVAVSEGEILRRMPMERGERKNGVWGDPDAGFVGDVDGVMGITGYGIHWNALARVAMNWRKASIIRGGSVADLVSELQRKRPVIVWGYDGSAKRLRWRTPGGKTVSALAEEHVRVVHGFKGDPRRPEGFYLLDPDHGPVFWKTSELLKNWGSLGRSGLVVY